MVLGYASWAGSRAKPSGPQRVRSKAGRRGEEKATAATAGLRAEKKEEKKVILFFFKFFFKASSKCNFNSIRNPTSNQAIQNNMQRHECTFMVVDLIFGFIFNKIIIS